MGGEEKGIHRLEKKGRGKERGREGRDPPRKFQDPSLNSTQ